MPRRKRRDSAGRKEPLTFIESPLNIPHAIPSPVFAADCPCTADVIAVDGATAQWVSPQFHNPPRPSRVTRSRRRRTSPEDSAIPAKAKAKKLDKLVPLKFLGDKSPSPEMICKTKTHAKRNQDTRFRKLKRKSNGHETSANSSFTCENDIEGTTPVRTSTRLKEVSRKKSKTKTELVDDVFGIEATGAFKRLQEHQATTSEGDELPDDFAAIKTTRKRKGKKTRKLNLTEVDLDLTLPENDNAGNSASTSNSPVFGTQHLPDEAKKGTRKRRLFSVSESKQTLQEDATNNETIEEVANVSDNFRPSEIDTPSIREVVRHLQPPLSARCPNVSSPGRKTVLSGRSTRLKCLLANTPIRMATPKKVLAYDTPESEYGMPVRQRQLKHWKSFRSRDCLRE